MHVVSFFRNSDGNYTADGYFPRESRFCDAEMFGTLHVIVRNRSWRDVVKADRRRTHLSMCCLILSLPILSFTALYCHNLLTTSLSVLFTTFVLRLFFIFEENTTKYSYIEKGKNFSITEVVYKYCIWIST